MEAEKKHLFRLDETTEISRLRTPHLAETRMDIVRMQHSALGGRAAAQPFQPD